jgi:hypothetical protein
MSLENNGDHMTFILCRHLNFSVIYLGVEMHNDKKKISKDVSLFINLLPFEFQISLTVAPV